MLTLTRKVGESITIPLDPDDLNGPSISITIKEIRRNSARIGIQAPKYVKIYRDEIHENMIDEANSEE